MNHYDNDEHDNLWELLGKARPPRVSPFFSRNVLRTIRSEAPEPRAGWLALLSRHWRTLSVSVAMLVVFIGISLKTGPRDVAEVDSRALDEMAHEVATSPDFPVIENLDTLLAFDDNDVWLDPSLR